jgi:ribonuclease PH
LIALVDALKNDFGQVSRDAYPLKDSVAAISVGICDGIPRLDLDYQLDVDAQVDMNVVMTGSRRFIELQGTGEESTFDDQQLAELLALAKLGIGQVIEAQRTALGADWPFA